MLTYCKRGSCPSTPSLDTPHVSRLGCIQPRLDKTFPHHQILKIRKKHARNVFGFCRDLSLSYFILFFTTTELTLTQRGGCRSNNKQSKYFFLLTHRGQTHSWPQRDLDQCFHDKTETGRREVHCISLWHPAHIHSK